MSISSHSHEPVDDAHLADLVVEEMAHLGAVFAIGDSGREGLARWTWEPRPETMRDAIRDYWRTLADRPGSTAMAAAIRRLQQKEGRP